MTIRHGDLPETFGTRFCQEGIPLPELSPEEVLLVHFSRSLLLPAVLKAMNKILRGEVDWKVFLDGSKRHRLHSRIYHHCVKHGLQIPSQVTRSLEDAAKTAKETTSQCFHEIEQIRRALLNVDAPVVLQKGPALIHQVYDSQFVRPFRDIDLLTPTCFVPEVEGCLRNMGYEPEFKYSVTRIIRPATPLEIQRNKYNYHLRPMRKFENDIPGSIPVELHYTGFSKGKFDFDSIVKNSENLEAIGSGLKVPSLADQVILTSIHLHQHVGLGLLIQESTSGWVGILKYLSDVYACLRIYLAFVGDWAQLTERSIDIHANEMLGYALYYLNIFYGRGTVPEGMVSYLISPGELEVPLSGNICVTVDSIDHFLQPDIKTATSTYGPALWMLNLPNVIKRLRNEFDSWNAQDGHMLAARCHRVATDSLVDGMPDDETWRLAEEQSIDEDNPNRRGFFRTHLAQGLWPSQGGVKGYLRLLWNDQHLFIRTRVTADCIHYVSSDSIRPGEMVTFHVSNLLDKEMTVNKVSVQIREGGYGELNRSMLGEKLLENVVRLEDVRLLVCTSSDEYCLVVGIPWDAMSMIPYPGFSFGFDSEIRHCYLVRRPFNEFPQPKTVIRWSGGPFPMSHYPEFYGTGILWDRSAMSR